MSSSLPLLAFDLEGKVKLESPLPKPRVLEVSEKHTDTCGKTRISPRLKVSPEEGYVANAVVKLEGPFVQAMVLQPREERVLDQIDCEFKPHVLLMPVGSTLSILNSDGFLHNVRAFDENTEMLFNDAMPKKGQMLKKRFDKAGRVVIRCGIHPWMHAWAIVQEHPFYAVTDEQGFFKISDIPEGNYKLSIWHEELGEIQTEVSPASSPPTIVYPSIEA